MTGADAAVTATHLAPELLTLAFCWRLERRDGIALGLTSHDRDMMIAGFPYRAAPGLVPSAFSRGIGLEVENMDLQGALSSDAISEDDLRAGRWDGAVLWLHLTQWEEPGALWLELMRGTLGTVEQKGEAFSVELRGPNMMLQRSFMPETSPGCRASLGDKACRVDLAHRRHIIRVAAVDEEIVAVDGGGLGASDYAFGRLRWMEGANCGLTQLILANDGTSITLADIAAYPVEPGTRAIITQGCDKRLETCRGRFSNAVNFRGEPYLPGSDLLTRYPGAL